MFHKLFLILSDIISTVFLKISAHSKLYYICL
jgi:hypothetical protein